MSTVPSDKDVLNSQTHSPFRLGCWKKANGEFDSLIKGACGYDGYIFPNI